MKTLWILGAGQLGTMLRHAAIPLAIDVRPVALDATDAPAPAPDDIVTAEIEHWPDSPATRVLAAHPNFINQPVFGLLADRRSQKALMDRLQLATSPWCELATGTSTGQLHDSLGERVLLKRRIGGYDGKGQHWLRKADNDAIPGDWFEAAIAEAAIDFDEEVSLVGMRDRDGNTYFYPLALNLHVNGVLTASIAPLSRLRPLQQQAETMLGTLLADLDYVGVMAMECFRTGDKLLINELAPRVHNSGHWTQAGASVSQFESHVRAVTGLPLVTPAIRGTTVMLNLLGVPRDDRWLSLPGTELFWYGKSVRPGRKVGHINLCLAEGQGNDDIHALGQLMPAHYQAVFAWVDRNLRG